MLQKVEADKPGSEDSKVHSSGFPVRANIPIFLRQTQTQDLISSCPIHHSQMTLNPCTPGSDQSILTIMWPNCIAPMLDSDIRIGEWPVS